MDSIRKKYTAMTTRTIMGCAKAFAVCLIATGCGSASECVAGAEAWGFDAYVSAIVPEPDGNFLVGGSFTTVGGLARPALARLYSDGRLDTSFNPALPASSRVDALAVQADGKVIVGGYFPEPQAPGGFYTLLRLNADGSADVLAAQPDGSPDALYVQADGRILVGGGSMDMVANEPRLHIARLNADLSLDPVFRPSVPQDSDVYSFVEQADGSILIAGRFETIADPSNEIFANSLARVDANGNVDPGFIFPIQYTGDSAYSVFQARLLSDGRFIAGGYYNLADAGITTVSMHYSDGTLDATSFTPNTLGGPRVLVLQADGKVLLGGVFNIIGNASDQLARNNIGRLNATGLPDSQFIAETTPGPGGQVTAIAELADGKILVGGAFTDVDGHPCNYIARLLSTGALDPSFNVDDTVFAGDFDP